MRSLALFAVPILLGCVSLDRPAADQRRFVLEAPRPTQEAAAATGHLAVLAFHANPTWANAGFVHRARTGDVEADFHAEFFVPPAVMVADATRRWLADAGLFATVTGDGSRVAPTHALEADVTELYVDGRGAEPAAVLAVEFLLLDAERRALVLHLRCSHRTSLADLRPETIAQGWSAALAAVLAEFEAALRTKLTR